MITKTLSAVMYLCDQMQEKELASHQSATTEVL